jgi:hypothetical protein
MRALENMRALEGDKEAKVEVAQEPDEYIIERRNFSQSEINYSDISLLPTSKQIIHDPAVFSQLEASMKPLTKQQLAKRLPKVKATIS